MKNSSPFDIQKVRNDFPILKRIVNGKALIYFDNGATAQKPQAVIDVISNYYSNENANIHRGVHTLSREITETYEAARATVQKHINAAFPHEIIFTKGTTESINLVAFCLAKINIFQGDEIIISAMEHHSNILPWQQICEEKKAVLKIIPINENGELSLEDYKKLFSSKTKIVAITHISNTLGTINPIKEMIALAHQNNIPVLVDGAQAVPHTKIDVQELDADFYCFSGHKVFGPTGIGVLYGKEKILNTFPPYQTGGGTIKTVTFEKTIYEDSPLKFEAGTPHIAGALGLAAALNYIQNIGLENIFSREKQLLDYATEKLSSIKDVRIIGTAKEKAGVLSFFVEDTHPFDVGTILDQLGIAVRTGHHCTQPLMNFYKIPGTVRATFAFYNTEHEIDELAKGMERVVKMLK